MSDWHAVSAPQVAARKPTRLPFFFGARWFSSA